MVDDVEKVPTAKFHPVDVLEFLKRNAGERFSARGVADALGSSDRERVGGVLETLLMFGAVKFDGRNRLWFYEGKVEKLPESASSG